MAASKKGPGFVAMVIVLCCLGQLPAKSELERSSELAHRAFSACRSYLEAWSRQLDPNTGLLPQTLDGETWTPENSAADNFPFMVIASRFLSPMGEAERLFARAVVGEKLHTIQTASLPSEYNLVSGVRTERSIEQLIFGASEYAKDGLVPMLEILGPGPWSFRMQELVEGIFQLAPISTHFGALPSNDAEVNGEMLQVLCRLYWMTGRQAYLDWSRRIGDAYFYEVLPLNYGVPAHYWDFEARRSRGKELRLRDHGCEIISGLSLLYAIEVEKGSPRALSYRPAMKRMLDRIVQIGTHESGLHYNSIVAATGDIVDSHFSDNWGYNYDAFLTFFMVSGEEQYRNHVQKVLRNLHLYRAYDWEPGKRAGADGYADSIEGALGLLSHVSVDSAHRWVETETRRMLGFQQEDGVVEGWWGDGNFCRTALMFALFQTKGTSCVPWREDLRLSAEPIVDGYRIRLSSSSSWNGRLRFDPTRHCDFLGMDKDYPRINAFPEWFTIESLQLYEIRGLTEDPQIRLGQELIDGLSVELDAVQPLHLQIRPATEPYTQE